MVNTSRSSSTNAVSFSSACTIKRFPFSRCASATKIVCPLELIVEIQPQLNPALLRLSANALLPRTVLLVVQCSLWCGFTHFRLCADFLKGGSHRFKLLFQPCDGLSLLLHRFVLFEKLIEQHRIH